MAMYQLRYQQEFAHTCNGNALNRKRGQKIDPEP